MNSAPRELRTRIRLVGGPHLADLVAKVDGSLSVDLAKLATPGLVSPSTREPAKPADLLREPSLVELATNFTAAMARWAKAGAPVLDQAGYDSRAAACATCEYWDEKGNLGLGKCKAPGCGCTRLKRWLSTEVCKHPAGSRWPVL